MHIMHHCAVGSLLSLLLPVSLASLLCLPLCDVVLHFPLPLSPHFPSILLPALACCPVVAVAHQRCLLRRYFCCFSCASYTHMDSQTHTHWPSPRTGQLQCRLQLSLLFLLPVLRVLLVAVVVFRRIFVSVSWPNVRALRCIYVSCCLSRCMCVCLYWYIVCMQHRSV